MNGRKFLAQTMQLTRKIPVAALLAAVTLLAGCGKNDSTTREAVQWETLPAR
jgi:outer membrane murein-binding lipoprotein Lpp